MKKTKKISSYERNRRGHWYGRKTIKKGQKVCWIAKQDKNGWAIGLAFGSRVLWLRNFRVKDKNEVNRIKKSVWFTISPKK